MALHHDAKHRLATGTQLTGHVLGYQHLVLELLAAVGMAEIDHHLLRQPRLLQPLHHLADVGGAVVRLAATAQNDVAIRVTGGRHYGGVTVLGHRQEVVRRTGGANGVDSHLDGAVGAVLEAHRAGESGGQLAVHLGFGGARPDGAPAHQIRHVLRGDHVEELGGGRQPHVVEIQQQFATQAQAVVDLAAVVEVGVVDQPLPAHSGARLLEIDPHHDLELIFELVTQRLEALAVFQRRDRIVDGAWANHHQQAIIVTGQNAVNGLARFKHRIWCGLGGRKLLKHRNRGQ